MAQTQNTFENLPDEKRERVLAEATREFADHGYHQASVNRIVGRLGIAKGSLFKYFGNKQGLFEYLFGQAVSQFKKPLKEIRDTASDDFFDRIEKSLLAGVEFIDSHPLVYRIYLKMLFQENFPLRDTFLSEVRQASTKYIHALVEDGFNNGQIRQELDRDMTVYHINTVLDRFLHAYAVPSLDGGVGIHGADPTIIKAKAHAVTDFLRHGLSTSS